MFFIKRYVIDYAIISILGLSGWGYLIYAYDGLYPILAGIAVILFMVCYIPFLIYEDYIKIKETWLDYKKYKQKDISKETFQKNFLIKVSDEFGIPEFISSPLLSKIIKEKV